MACHLGQSPAPRLSRRNRLVFTRSGLGSRAHDTWLDVDTEAMPERRGGNCTQACRAGQCCTAGALGHLRQLAEAAGMGEAKNAARGAASALSFLPPGAPMAEWVLPWHRIRLENGHMKSRDRGEIVDPRDPANELFIAEGGRLINGAAPQGRRYPLASKVRARRSSARPIPRSHTSGSRLIAYSSPTSCDVSLPRSHPKMAKPTTRSSTTTSTCWSGRSAVRCRRQPSARS